MVTPLDFGLLVLAGLGAGLTGSVAGLASLISYPALLATGIPPVTANVTNTVGLVLSSVGSVSASRPVPAYLINSPERGSSVHRLWVPAMAT